MTEPAQPPAQPEGFIQAQVSLADTPFGQKVALTLTILLGKENAAMIAEQVAATAKQMSGAGLIIASGNGMVPKGQG